TWPAAAAGCWRWRRPVGGCWPVPCRPGNPPIARSTGCWPAVTPSACAPICARCRNACQPRESFMQLNAYLNFDGNGAEALAFYERHLGAKIEYRMTYGEAPPMPENAAAEPGCAGSELPKDWQNKIMHA